MISGQARLASDQVQPSPSEGISSASPPGRELFPALQLKLSTSFWWIPLPDHYIHTDPLALKEASIV